MTAALEGGEWSAARPGRTLPPGKTWYTFYKSLGGPQGWSGRAEKSRPHRDFFFSFWIHLLHFQTYTQQLNITSASCFGSSFPVPCHVMSCHVIYYTYLHSLTPAVCVWGGAVSLPAPCPILTTVPSFLAPTRTVRFSSYYV